MIRDYELSIFLFLLGVLISLLSIIAIIHEEETNALQNTLGIAVCLAFPVLLILQITKFKKELREGITISFDKKHQKVSRNKNVLCSFEDIKATKVGPYYDSENDYYGHEIKLSIGINDIDLWSGLKEETDIHLAQVIADFIDKPLIQVKSF